VCATQLRSYVVYISNLLVGVVGGGVAGVAGETAEIGERLPIHVP